MANSLSYFLSLFVMTTEFYGIPIIYNIWSRLLIFAFVYKVTGVPLHGNASCE